jgi:hypothetical protein
MCAPRFEIEKSSTSAMGHQPSTYTPPVPLEERCTLVLDSLARCGAPCSITPPAQAGAAHEVRFTHSMLDFPRRVTTDLSIRCSQEEGIVVRTRIGRVVEEFIWFGPVAAQVLAIAANAYNWSECLCGTHGSWSLRVRPRRRRRPDVRTAYTRKPYRTGALWQNPVKIVTEI